MIPHELLSKKNGDDCCLLLTIGQRMLLLLCVMLLCWIVGSVLNGLIIAKFGQTARVLRIAAVIQSLLQIILPSLVTALMISRYPARFLEIDRVPRASMTLLSIALLVVSMPAFNSVIQWNASLHLPDFMQGVEQWMRQAEDRSAATIRIMQGGTSVGDLILNILIIGVMAGLGEELLFRGTIQRMLTTSGMNPHAAIWIVAVLFSAIHMQFFGFLPRLLLGAYFGYLLVWGRSVWLPAGAHALNNSIYVVAMWLYKREGTPELTVDNIGLGDTWPVALLSLAATMWLIALIRRLRR